MEPKKWMFMVIALFFMCKNTESSISDIFKDNTVPTNIMEFERKIINLMNSVLKQIFPLAVRVVSESNVSQPCSLSLLHFFTNLKTLKEWAVKMLDASAKPPSSILQGTLTVFGGYDECLDIDVKNKKNKTILRGQYCMVELKPPNFFFSELKQLNSTGLKTSLWQSLQRYADVGNEFAFRLGLCVPDKCSAQDIKQVVYLATRTFGITSNAKCHTKRILRPNVAQILFLCFFGCLGLLVTLGTILDVIVQHTALISQEGGLITLLVTFSMYTNTITLFRTSQRVRSLAAARGCRVLSAFWIVLGHTYFFPHIIYFSKYRRLTGLGEFVDELMFKTITNATVALDTFFLLSGMLLVHTTWNKLQENKGLLNPITFFLSRMLRVLPAQFLIAALLVISPLFGSGPLWDETFEEAYNACRDNWWANLLFIQNFWPIEKICLFHTWFIGVLLQISILSFILLIILYRRPKLGIALTVIVIVCGCVVIAAITSIYRLPSHFSLLGQDIPTWRLYFNLIYSRPYTYVSSYCIGMLLGYAVVNPGNKEMKPVIKLIIWIISTVCALFVLYGVYLLKLDKSTSLNVMYAALHRSIWSTALFWILYTCVTGHGGIISRFLSWKGLIPLDRMVFLIYLIHPLVLYYSTARSRAVIYMGHVEQVYIYLATLVITLCLSYLFNVTFEQPFKRIEILIKKKLTRTRNNLPDAIPSPPPPPSSPEFHLKTPEIIVTPATPVPVNNHSSHL